jgi:four helix bundle protein
MVKTKYNFEDLRVYQAVLGIVNEIYLITQKWPKDEMFGLTNQLRRAIVSVLLNIAEGSSRSKKDFRHFLDMARGSGYESVACLQIALVQGYVNKKDYDELYSKLQVISKMVSALKRSLIKL